MPSWDDFDADQEEVFGSSYQVDPKIVKSSEKDMNDPLRKVKINVTSCLLAEANYVTAEHIRARLIEEQDCYLISKDYGCHTIDELFQKMSDKLLWAKDKNGDFVYSLRRNAQLDDLAEMVAKQRTKEQTERERAKVRGRTELLRPVKGPSTYGAAFKKHYQRKRPVSVPDESVLSDMNQRRSPRQGGLPELRSHGKTEQRCIEINDFLCKNGAFVEENGSRYYFMKLGDLEQKFFDYYQRPMWIKRMNEKELYAAFTEPEWAGFFKIRRNFKGFFEILCFERNAESPSTSEEEGRPYDRDELVDAKLKLPIQPIGRRDPPFNDFPTLHKENNNYKTRKTYKMQNGYGFNRGTHVSRVSNGALPNAGNGFLDDEDDGWTTKKLPVMNTTFSGFGADQTAKKAETNQSCFGAPITTGLTPLLPKLDEKGENDDIFAPIVTSRYNVNTQLKNVEGEPKPDDEVNQSIGFGADSFSANPSFSFGAPPPSSQQNLIPVIPAPTAKKPTASIAARFGTARNEFDAQPQMDPHPVKTEAPSPISTPIQPLLNISMSGRGETRPFGSPPEEDIVSFARSLTNRKKLLKDCSSNQMMMINFSPDVFKVTTEFTGTEIVQLSPEVNIGRLKLEFKTLRTAVFSDFAWLADVRSKQYRLSDGFYLCSVLHPVAPAHVIMGAEVPANTQIMEQINDEIQKVPLLPLDVKKIVPGMECIYAYESAGFTYLRALILGGTSNGQGAKIILVDHHTFYALDAEFSSLRQMAPQFSLKRLKTRIFLGQIRGVDGVKRKLQDEVHEKILKERNQGEVVCAVFGTDKPNEVNLIDYVMMENGEDKDWISKYLLSSDSANPAPKHPDFLNLTLALQVCDRLPQPDRFSNPELGHFEEQGAHNQDQMEVFEHVPSPVEESQVEMRDAESSPERIEVAEVSQRETTSKNSELRIQLLTELGLEAITRNNFASYLRYHESIMEQSRLAYFRNEADLAQRWKEAEAHLENEAKKAFFLGPKAPIRDDTNC